MAGVWSLMLSNTKSMQRHADAWEVLGAEHQPSSWGLWAVGCRLLPAASRVGFTELNSFACGSEQL